MAPIMYILVIFAAFGGFLLAFYIRHKKSAKEALVCPIGADCDAVIYSEYSKFLGLPVEMLGLFYYGVVAVSYGLFLVLPELAGISAVFGILVFSATAFLFSLYLTFIQAFALKQWCSWCLTSAGLSTLIFAFALWGSELGFIPLLAAHQDALLLIHLSGLALGLGAVTITDIFFMKFLKDFRVSEGEADILNTILQVAWFGLAVLVLGGGGLYLGDGAAPESFGVFGVKIIAVLVIILNGAVLNFIVQPRLVKISLRERHAHAAGELHRGRKLAYALGAVSLVSWYAAFILSILDSLPFSFGVLLAVYFAALGGAVILSQLLEYSAEKAV